MNLKIIFIAIYFSILCLVRAKNLVIVIDNTYSMEDEINLLKKHIGVVLNDRNITSQIERYVLVSFDGRDVKTLTSTIAYSLSDGVRNLKAKSPTSLDCPENSMTALLTALELSQQESYVFLFTDAYAKDEGKHNSIVTHCRSTNSKINIILTGECVQSENGGGSIDVYYDVTRACSGTVFQVDSIHYHPILRFFNEMLKSEWNNIITHDRFTEDKEFKFSVGSFASDAVIVASGEDISIDILNNENESPTVTNLLDTRNAKVLRISQPKSDYKTYIRCHGRTSVTFYSKFVFPFRYGFSSLLPRNLRETSLRPLPDRKNYIVVTVSKNHDITPEKITVVSDSSNSPQNLEYNEETDVYTAEHLFEQNAQFKLVVTAKSNVQDKEVKLISELIETQKSVKVATRWKQPYVKILEEQSIVVQYGSNAKLACKVIGYPKPEIWWENRKGDVLPSPDTALLEIPSTYVSYAYVENATQNETISCKSKNSEGEYHQDMELFIKREYKFNIIKVPEDEDIEYETEKTLYCKIDAYPEANVTWYKNNVLIESSDNLVVNEGELLIRSMGLNDVGDYKCEVSNNEKSKTFSATLKVSGLVAPEISLGSEKIAVHIEDKAEIECRVTGKPKPTINWKYKADEFSELTDIPIEIEVNEGKLKIEKATPKHNGIYRCTATNIKADSYRDVIFEAQYAPIINDSENSQVIVKEGDTVELPCQVDAIPKPRVWWEFIKHGEIEVEPFDKRHETDEQNKHRFFSLWKDSGMYRCIAENDVGRAEKTVNVRVNVAPYIEPPLLKVVSVKEGGSTVLTCNVSFGNPKPTVQWKFIAENFSSNVITSNVDSNNSLSLDNISKSQEGTYVCSAKNEVWTDSIKIKLKVV